MIVSIKTTSKTLTSAIDYVRDATKANPAYYGSIGCMISNPIRDMNLAKRLLKKSPDKGFKHIVVAFNKKEPVNEDVVSKMTREIMKPFQNFQCFWAVHTNTPYMHSHVIINNVDCHGNAFKMWKPQLHNFRTHINNVAQKYGVAPLEGTYGHKNVQTLDELELSLEEEKRMEEINMYSSNFMPTLSKKHENYKPIDSYHTIDNDYSQLYDDSFTELTVDDNTIYDISDVQSEVMEESDNPTIFLGSAFNIVTNSAEKASCMISKIGNHGFKYTAAEIVAIAKDLPSGVNIDLGNRFNIILSNNCDFGQFEDISAVERQN